VLKLFGKFLADLKIFGSHFQQNSFLSNTEKVAEVPGGIVGDARILSEAQTATHNFESPE
jgi:hypothetical protein